LNLKSKFDLTTPEEERKKFYSFGEKIKKTP
jgi:hypothetical protein